MSAAVTVATGAFARDAAVTSSSREHAVTMSPMRAIRKPVIRATRCTLRDGTPVILRPVGPSDAQYAHAFFDWLSAETRYLRFMYQVKELSPEMLASALEQDGLKRVSLVVAPLKHVADDPQAIALGRYAPSGEPDVCEIAVTVGDSWHGRGVGQLLVTRLISLATRGGYHVMCASAFSANTKMIGLTRSLGFEVRAESGGITMMRLALR